MELKDALLLLPAAAVALVEQQRHCLHHAVRESCAWHVVCPMTRMNTFNTRWATSVRPKDVPRWLLIPKRDWDRLSFWFVITGSVRRMSALSGSRAWRTGLSRFT